MKAIKCYLEVYGNAGYRTDCGFFNSIAEALRSPSITEGFGFTYTIFNEAKTKILKRGFVH
ncbi:MAG: hypothetical protein Q4A15_02710 [Prevotellaceae bacterium]|nr:hypothetical protein [Prevotellaceae bacterium]